jgi:signal peptidase I
LVKRIVAVPGDRIELRDDHLVINGETASYALVNNNVPSALVLDETVSGKVHSLMIQPRQRAMRSFGPMTVPPGSYFMMGDNRDNSFDSRYFGFVSRDRILGRATLVAMSFDRDHYYQPRFARFGHSLL